MTACVARLGGQPPNKFAADSKEPAAFVFQDPSAGDYFTSRSLVPADTPFNKTSTTYFPVGQAVFLLT